MASQCELCKNAKVKNKFLGGKKYICTIQNREVCAKDSCAYFVRDGDKVLQRAGFRPHEYGSSDGCDSCAYRDSVQAKTGRVYICKKNNVRFYPGFKPMDHICNNFVDGGLDALTGFMADLMIEEDRLKKGGK